MKDLELISFSGIEPKEKYLVITELYDRRTSDPTELEVKTGTGEDLIEYLQTIFPVEEGDSLEEFYEKADSYNGDGWNFVQIFKL